MNGLEVKQSYVTTILFLVSFILPQVLLCQTTVDTITNATLEADTIVIPYEEIELDCLCVPKNSYIIIRSYKQLLDLFKGADNPECKNFSPTEFDFNKEVIIGFYAVLKRIGNKEPILISIENIPSDNKYICEVTVIQSVGISTLMPFPLRKTISFPINSSNCEIEVVIVDYKNRFKQSTKNCYEHL
jgi:hypothetical protein